MKEMLRLGFVLAAFAAVACVALALVNNVTAPAIAAVKSEKLRAGFAEVFSDADSFKEVTDFAYTSSSAVSVEGLYAAEKGGKTSGVVVKVTGPTYDKATVLVGISSGKNITGIKILEISDTPGFGQRATEPAFYTQFAGKSAVSDFVPNTDFDAISGATITTNGFSSILKEASAAGLTYLEAAGGAQ
ncbi:MAG: FMN-binding protein [Treponemataceae bacterium]|nr:FMN-binding protein [Treponemataceae bacterium]